MLHQALRCGAPYISTLHANATEPAYGRALLAGSSPPEQLAVRSGSVKHHSIARDAVDQQPIRVHMALCES